MLPTRIQITHMKTNTIGTGSIDDIRFDDRTKSLLDDQKKQWFW